MLYYFFAMVNNFKCFFITVSVVLTIVYGVKALFHTMEGEEDKLSKTPFMICILLFFLASALPNQKQLAFIVAAPAIVNNEDVQGVVKDIPAIMKLGTEYLKETLENVNSSNRPNDSNIPDTITDVE